MVYIFIIALFFLIIVLLIFLIKKKKIVFRKSRLNEEKILREDILKSVYNHESQNSVCNVNSLSEKLNKTNKQIQSSVNQLLNSNHIETDNKTIRLTESGKNYALKIIRFHRLYEKYLADQTNLDEKNWHHIAEDIEHNLTNEEADKLAAQIGNPVFDPHGDPIPSSQGELPDDTGIPLSELKPGNISIVIHIEDEPDHIYQNIVSKGIYKGIQIRFLGTFNNEVSFYANEKLCSLSLQEAKNINVGLPKLEKIHLGEFKKLSSLSVGQRGKIIGIAKSLRGQQRRRLMDLGIVPGTEIEVELESLTGDPLAYKVRGTTIALRKNQTDKIYIEPL